MKSDESTSGEHRHLVIPKKSWEFVRGIPIIFSENTPKFEIRNINTIVQVYKNQSVLTVTTPRRDHPYLPVAHNCYRCSRKLKDEDAHHPK